MNTMTDIVERLRARGWGINAESAREAADEIERLREQVDALRLVATSHEPEALRQQAEIEQLQAQLTTRSGYQYVSSVQEMSDGLTMQAHEIERLQAALRSVADEAGDKAWGGNHLAARISLIARRALEPKP